eukprot:TRINITY_DN14965_c0_g3_i1.p2 TRINITY_DN14965_c0_g3~~TRINITY_DN14965_c0_g3_i1.p2  ORF type:complete len:485 (+),score=66.89 TRINITY_DN14965_c0_g3_i1:193-1647(+)
MAFPGDHKHETSTRPNLGVGAEREQKRLKLDDELRTTLTSCRDAVVAANDSNVQLQKTLGSIMEFQTQMMSNFASMMQNIQAASSGATSAGAPASSGANVASLPAATLTLPNANDAPAAIQYKEDDLPKDLMKKYTQVIRNFENDLKKSIRASKRETRCKEIVDFLAQHADRYPPGVKPFTCASDVEWDLLAASMVENDRTIEIKIPKGCSRKEALSIFYRSYVTHSRALDLEVAQAHVETVKPLARKDLLFTLLKDATEDFFKPNDTLGLEKPSLSSKPSDEFITQFHEKKYKQLYDKLCSQNEKELEQKVKDDEASKKMNKAICDARPEALLQQTIEQVITKIKNEELTELADEVMDADVDPPPPDANLSTLCSKLISAISEMSKNGGSAVPPTRDKGPKTSGNPKGKGKGKGKASGKTKGVGREGKGPDPCQAKTLTKWSMKGKGSGKGTDRAKGKDKGKNGGKNNKWKWVPWFRPGKGKA